MGHKIKNYKVKLIIDYVASLDHMYPPEAPLEFGHTPVNQIKIILMTSKILITLLETVCRYNFVVHLMRCQLPVKFSGTKLTRNRSPAASKAFFASY